MLVFVLHFSHLTLFAIRQAGWGPKNVGNNEVAPGGFPPEAPTDPNE